MSRTGPRRVGGGEKRLLAAASRLFAARGFLGISVRELVQAAGVSRPVLYYHFGSKEGLYLAAARKAKSGHEAALARAAGGAGAAPERIRRVCRAHAAAGSERAFRNTGAGSAGVGGGTARGSSRRRRSIRIVEVVRGLVNEGIEKGELAACDPRDAALALVGVAEAAAAHLPRGLSGSQERERLNRALFVVLRGLTPRSGRSRSGAATRRGRR